MALANARSGRRGLACEGRQHIDGEHECAARFWPQVDGLDVLELRARACRRGWWSGTHERSGKFVDLCPYHGPDGTSSRLAPVIPIAQKI